MPGRSTRTRAGGGLAVLLAGSVLAACGGDGGGGAGGGQGLDSSTGGEPADLQIAAEDNHFGRDRYTTTAGTRTIEYVQEGEARHTLLLEDADGDPVEGLDLEVDGSPTDSGSVDLAPGTYTLYCDVPGHRESGMEAVLEVG